MYRFETQNTKNKTKQKALWAVFFRTKVDILFDKSVSYSELLKRSPCSFTLCFYCFPPLQVSICWILSKRPLTTYHIMRWSFLEPFLQGILKLFLKSCLKTAETWHFLSNDSQIMSQFKDIQEINQHGSKDAFPEKAFFLLLILFLALALINTNLKTFADTPGKGSQPLLFLKCFPCTENKH